MLPQVERLVRWVLRNWLPISARSRRYVLGAAIWSSPALLALLVAVWRTMQHEVKVAHAALPEITFVAAAAGPFMSHLTMPLLCRNMRCPSTQPKVAKNAAPACLRANPVAAERSRADRVRCSLPEECTRPGAAGTFPCELFNTLLLEGSPCALRPFSVLFADYSVRLCPCRTAAQSPWTGAYRHLRRAGPLLSSCMA